MTSTLSKIIESLRSNVKQTSRLTVMSAVFLFFGLDETHAERRCTTVTTGDKAVVYVSRIYTCANADGTGATLHGVLGGVAWTIPANSKRTRYFEVPCGEEKRVIGVNAIYAWVGEDCTDGLTRIAIPLGTALGSKTTRLLCGGQPARGVCSDIFSCGLGDEDLTSVCFTQPDPNDCICSDVDPPVEGVDYVISGQEIDLLPKPIPPPSVCASPTVSEWGLIVITLLLLALGTLTLERRHLIVAGAGGLSATIERHGPPPLFVPKTFGKCLSATATLTVVALVVGHRYFGALDRVDVVGAMASAVFAAYLVHLWVRSPKA